MSKKINKSVLLLAVALAPGVASAANLTVNGVVLGTFTSQTSLQVNGNGDITGSLVGFTASGSTGGTTNPPPPAATYTIGGTVSGLAANTSVTLLDNGADSTQVSTNGAFTFPTAQSAYNVTVGTQPSGQQCTVSGGVGTATANVTNITVTCATAAPTPANVTIVPNLSYPIAGVFYSLGPSEIKVFPYTPSANQTYKRIATVQTSSNGTSRSVWVSTTPGGSPLADPNCSKTGISTNTYYGTGAPNSYSCQLQAGTKYYVNVQNSFTPLASTTSCGYSNCGFVLTINGDGQ